MSDFDGRNRRSATSNALKEFWRYDSINTEDPRKWGHVEDSHKKVKNVLLSCNRLGLYCSFKRVKMKKYGKFAALIVVVIGTLVWLATAEMKDNQTYYKTITELGQMGNKAYTARVRVGGDVESGSIQRVGSRVEFVLAQETTKLKVAYTGTDPLPDTFKDGAQALADGKLGKDGVFVANRIQAKCASKYEAKPGQLKPGQTAPNINSGTTSGV